MPKWIVFILCVALPMATGLTSGFLNRNESGGPWYRALEKPPFNPPSWVFAPVWTLLYLLMGVSFYLVVQAAPSQWRKPALIIFAVQLILNFCWSFLFFRFHMLGVAAAEIVVLLVAIILMIIFFYKVDHTAAYLQLPYLLWVSFATLLSVSIYWLNRHAG